MVEAQVPAEMTDAELWYEAQEIVERNGGFDRFGGYDLATFSKEDRQRLGDLWLETESRLFDVLDRTAA